MASNTHVVIAGGGFAGLETAFLLRHRLHDRVDITIVSDKDRFLFRPNTIYIPFGLDPAELEIPLDQPARRQHMRIVHDRVVGVNPAAHTLQLERSEVEYDKLVIATGAGMKPEEIPGLAEHGSTIWTPETMLTLRRTVERIVERGKAGTPTTVLFLIPPNNKCAGPLYEIVFMLDTHLRRQHARSPVKIVWATFEQSYIQAFGPKLHEVVTHEFAERGIEGHREKLATEVTASQVRFQDGEAIDYDELISFPPYVSAVRYDALPSDERGFIQTDPLTRAVQGVSDVYAPGDAGVPRLPSGRRDGRGDSSRRPAAGRAARYLRPVSMCVMEQFDKATFA